MIVTEHMIKKIMLKVFDDMCCLSDNDAFIN